MASDAAYWRAHRVKHGDRIREREKRWRHKNRERLASLAKSARLRRIAENGEKERNADRRKFRSYYARHRAKILVRAKVKRLANKEVFRQRDAANAKRHPIQYREKAKRRRALLLGATGVHTHNQWMARVTYYGWKCVYCSCELTELTLTKDHRKPLTKGGTEWPANLVPACRSCNSSKGNKEVFMAGKRGTLNFESPGDLDVVRTASSPVADTPADREHISSDWDDKPNCMDAMPKEGEAQFLYGSGKKG